jgi:hypothetical protein
MEQNDTNDSQISSATAADKSHLFGCGSFFARLGEKRSTTKSKEPYINREREL